MPENILHKQIARNALPDPCEPNEPKPQNVGQREKNVRERENGEAKIKIKSKII